MRNYSFLAPAIPSVVAVFGMPGAGGPRAAVRVVVLPLVGATVGAAWPRRYPVSFGPG